MYKIMEFTQKISLITSTLFFVLYSVLNLFEYDAMLKNFEVLNSAKATTSYTVFAYVGLYYVFILKTLFNLCILFALLTIIAITSVASFRVFTNAVFMYKSQDEDGKQKKISQVAESLNQQLSTTVHQMINIVFFIIKDFELFFILFFIIVPIFIAICITMYKWSQPPLQDDKASLNAMKTTHHILLMIVVFMIIVFISYIISQVIFDKNVATISTHT